MQYSLLRTTELSTFVKPLPIIFWFFIVLVSPKRPEGWWIALSLFLAAIGDILLDLGPNWLILATLPFLGSTLILALAFHLRLKTTSGVKGFLLLIPIALIALMFHQFMAPFIGEAAKIGAVLMALSTLLIWKSLSVLIFKSGKDDMFLYRLMGFIGACGIVANYVLYSINIGLTAIPRDLVIQLYYWGQAFVAWSFLKPYSPRH